MDKHRDQVDGIQAQWHATRPDVDVKPMAIIGRLHRLAGALTRELTTVFEEHGLSEGDFDVLATLRRSGPSCTSRPADLAHSTMVTTGGLTKRLDRLEKSGLIARSRPEGADGRTKMVRLTDRGMERIDAAFAAHMANESRLVGQLTHEEQAALESLLRTWLSHHETAPQSRP